ncbi:Na+-transporting methylmalonyl-CoA/oxaloacetate decarboxylase gamma subunit [Halanaerobium sp. MA284_MarDTE_T2]|nr:Na+-transporting methylmalonyl-CoA/oxaloacetate decarboxylase gamma subunit [Halanaerobium sp. MA284_MarDTE_T2]RCW86579.1 Na+-transporting methylmalonyl-CoA/oxaloacetate decarboxylase gamma subunit [Halanaerobium sp. DL-01]
MIIGMGTVFISLYLLSVFMYLLGKFFGDKKVLKKDDSSIGNSAEAEIDESEIDDGENGLARKRKIAAAAAAVYQLLDEEKRYRIISIKKANSSWKR